MDEHMDTETDSPQSHASPTGNNTKPLKIRKKPGRKPNPASPAVRKAQNRAAQRAFRERKEKHMKELEVDTKRLIQERDQYYKETQQLTKENDILKCENWYLKGIVLSLQMVCFKSKIRIPRHTPHIDERARNIMANTAPPAIAVHLNGGGSTSNSSTNDSNDDMDKEQLTTATPDMVNKNQDAASTTSSNNDDAEGDSQLNQPIMLNNHTDASVSNNMAAIQALRFRLRIQSALFRENAAPYSAKPSVLQLAVPHDARIDLIPTVHMRDRMILFRNQFDLEDCLRLLINEAVFHGGNPSVAANWELPAVFFEKYWYLTTDYTMERTSQRWRQIKNMFKDDPTLAPSPPPQNRSPSTIPLSPIPSSAYSHQGSFKGTTDMDSFSESQRQQHSYYQQHPHQQYWPSLGQNDQQNSTAQQGKHANHHPTYPQQPSTVATDSDILALMAPSADIGSHYSPFARAPPASTNLHHYTNYDILPNAPPPPPSSIHQSDFVFQNDSLTQQQQDIHNLLQQDQNHHQQQQQHTPQQQWNQSYSFMDL